MNGTIQVRLFGSFALNCDNENIALPLVSARKLIAYLCLVPGKPVARTDISNELWPDSEELVNLNRLRTALVQSRSALKNPDVISGSKHHLQIDPAYISCDLWQATQAVTLTQISVDEAQEKYALEQLIQAASKPFLSGYTDLWIVRERKFWKNRVIDAQFRIAAFAENDELWNEATGCIEPILLQHPYDERAWTVLLRLYSKQGRHIEIYERFVETRKLLRKELGCKFTPSLLSLVESVRSGTQPPSQLLTSQSDMVTKALEAILTFSPQDSLEFLGSLTFRSEIIKNGIIARDILESVINHTEGFSETRMKCVVNLLVSYASVHDQEGAIKIAVFILEHDTDNARRRYAATLVSFAYFQIRNWEKAYHYGNLGVELSTLLDNAIQIASAKGQIASFDWHQGRLDEAKAKYEECIALMEDDHSLGAMGATLILKGNIAFIFTYQRKYAEAEKIFDLFIKVANSNNLSNHLALAMPTHGCLKILLGETVQGREILGRGLSLAYRRKDSRSFQIALDFASLGLAKLGFYGESLAVLELAGTYRKETKHTRSVAENMLVDDVNEMAKGFKASPEWLEYTGHRQLTIKILELLAAK